MVTFVAGFLLFAQLYMYTPGVGFGPSDLFSTPDGLTGRAIWILIGMAFGFMMWFNVWFVIWPNQKRILGIVQASAEEKAAAGKKAGMASRINTMLSIPMLYFMVAQQHAGISF